MVTCTRACKPPREPRQRAPAPPRYLFTNARDRCLLIEAPSDRRGQPVMSEATTYRFPADFTDFQRSWFAYTLLHGHTPRGVPIGRAGRAPRVGRPGEHEFIRAALNAKTREVDADSNGTCRQAAAV